MNFYAHDVDDPDKDQLDTNWISDEILKAHAVYLEEPGPVAFWK